MFWIHGSDWALTVNRCVFLLMFGCDPCVPSVWMFSAPVAIGDGRSNHVYVFSHILFFFRLDSSWFERAVKTIRNIRGWYIEPEKHMFVSYADEYHWPSEAFHNIAALETQRTLKEQMIDSCDGLISWEINMFFFLHHHMPEVYQWLYSEARSDVSPVIIQQNTRTGTQNLGHDDKSKAIHLFLWLTV